MANVYVDVSSLQDIADSIRAKNGTQNTYKPGEMADAIMAIPSGGVTPTGTINITANGTHDVTNYASAEVAVPTGITPTGTLEVTANGTYDVTNYASAEVDVPTGSTPVINSLSVTENGTYTAPTGVDGYSPITVNVPSVTPTGTKQISITANGTTTEDVTNYASAEITVNVPSSGVTLSGLAYPVIFQTTRSSSVALNRAVYNSSTIMGFARSNVTSSAPVTVNNMLTDGTHVFFNASAGSSITYNGSAADFVKNSTNFMLTIPDGFDGTIPFVIS